MVEHTTEVRGELVQFLHRTLILFNFFTEIPWHLDARDPQGK